MLTALTSRTRVLIWTLTQGSRVAWFLTHHLIVNKRRGPLTPDGQAPPKITGTRPTRHALARGVGGLLLREREHIRTGTYRRPAFLANPFRAIARSARFFMDLRRLDKRRLSRDKRQVATEDAKRIYPDYYLQNFHYQTGGYLTRASARLYDTQVETLFLGCAGAMRRQALPALNRFIAARKKPLRMLDIGCGTGAFMRELRRQWKPDALKITGLDLSHPYLREARLRGAHRVQGFGETLPFADASFDIVSTVYLFHELPPAIRRKISAEIARVLAPGGRFVFIDSLQTGDTDAYDGLLEIFPHALHEPYFRNYLREDVPALVASDGLQPRETTRAFLSKVILFEKAG